MWPCERIVELGMVQRWADNKISVLIMVGKRHDEQGSYCNILKV